MKTSASKTTKKIRRSRSPFFSKPNKYSFFQAKAEESFLSPSPLVQTRLTVRQSGDPQEKQADAMADQVVQRLSQSTPSVQTLCAECQEEEKQQSKIQRKEDEQEPPEVQMISAEEEEEIAPKLQDRTEAGTSMSKGALLSYRLSNTRGKGSALSDHTRYAMESAFGVDFGQVRTHTDQAAVQMNRELHAQAFTHGTDIYFNQGKFNPDSPDGKHLLAHELTHVVQQKGEALTPKIQRKPDDDKHDLTSSLLAGEPTLEKCFDGDQKAIIKTPDKGLHVFRMQQALLQLGFDLPKFGADTDYGGETAGAVKQFQASMGMSLSEQDGIVGKKTIGLLDRSVRNNQVETDEDVAKDDFIVTNQKQQQKDEACKGQPTDIPCPDPNTVVDTAADQAISMIDKVLQEQLPPVKNKKADYPAIFSQIFRNNDTRDINKTVEEVRNVYTEIKIFLGRLKKDKSLVRCGTACDGGCRSGTPAYQSFNKEKNIHLLTFCPDFETHGDRILIVLHEAHHAAIPGSSDKAYAFTRLFDKLDHKKALLNAASFHVYAAWVDTPGSQPIGQEIKDTNLIDDKTQKEQVSLSLAFMDQWFRLIPFDLSETVQGAEEARLKGVYKSKNARIFMTLVFSKWFGLTLPPAMPSPTDIQKLKAIEERTKKMKEAFNLPFVILETQDNSFWERGPGSGIALNQAVLQLDLQHMVTTLLQELVHATPNISAESEALYVLTLNDMRNLRNLDP